MPENESGTLDQTRPDTGRFDGIVIDAQGQHQHQRSLRQGRQA
jgi:hypothetical protein